MTFSDERGMGLVIALIAITMVMALGGALVLLTSSETLIAANYRSGTEALYAADAALERALVDLRNLPDWNVVLAGLQLSTFNDGAPGPRTLPDGTTISLPGIANMANCRHVAPCSVAALDAVTSDRPWGVNNPRWTLYGHGALANVSGPGSARSPFYVVMLVADDPSENDGDPARDGDTPGGVANPGYGAIVVRTEAFGPRRSHRAVEATIARIVPPPLPPAHPIRVLSWREAP